ncbi:hypothetical protein GGR92_004968 [Spirosoma lacussanchae]|uniref:hypothetical protein n=1 Tax=Spirosoma lacussanchae TaxID=1884249 RepID=UPI001109C85B|nr:hypothetical protein [Spirosoma lacussanchae]
MKRTEPPPPEGNYRRAKLNVPLGPLMPAGREGWVSQSAEETDEAGQPMLRFISATNHDLVFKVYANEVTLV